MSYRSMGNRQIAKALKEHKAAVKTADKGFKVVIRKGKWIAVGEIK